MKTNRIGVRSPRGFALAGMLSALLSLGGVVAAAGLVVFFVAQ